METELTTLIARPSRWQRAQRFPGAAIAGVGVWSLLYAEVWGLVLAVVGLWGAAEFWRGVRVTGDTLYMQGRVLRRTLPLDRIRQLGIAPSRTLWVRPDRGRTLVLHMVDVRTDRKGSLHDVQDRLRELAADAGAQLEPQQDDRVKPPRPLTPFFGW